MKKVYLMYKEGQLYHLRGLIYTGGPIARYGPIRHWAPLEMPARLDTDRHGLELLDREYQQLIDFYTRQTPDTLFLTTGHGLVYLYDDHMASPTITSLDDHLYVTPAFTPEGLLSDVEIYTVADWALSDLKNLHNLSEKECQILADNIMDNIDPHYDQGQYVDTLYQCYYDWLLQGIQEMREESVNSVHIV
jgi:hypothetical protein